LSRLKQAIAGQGVTLEKVLLTHGHLDHASGAARLARELGVPIEGLWPLGDDMQFVPGHGPMSTFGWERKTNPYVCDLALGRA
jgi:glyoxylase-like metal-dependent hydrolase (beta-lactamase superfamily II)